MSASNAWAEFAAVFSRTRSAHAEHEQAKAELKSLMPEDAKEANGIAGGGWPNRDFIPGCGIFRVFPACEMTLTKSNSRAPRSA